VLHRVGAGELRTLARHVAALETDADLDTGADLDDLDPAAENRAYTSCYQTHVPTLVESGIVEFKRDSGIVRPTQLFREVEAYLGWNSGLSDGRDIAVVCLLAAAFFGGVFVDAPLLSLVPLSVAGIVVIVSVAVAILYTIRRQSYHPIRRGDVESPR
jgi:hypothetical protein